MNGQEAYDWWNKMSLDGIKAVGAVIEAAEACAEDVRVFVHGEQGTARDRCVAFVAAVRALQAVKGE